MGKGVKNFVKSVLKEAMTDIASKKCTNEPDTFLGACERLEKSSNILLIQDIANRFDLKLDIEEVNCE